MDVNKFNPSKYKQDWAKEHKKQFKVDLNINEYNELCEVLKQKHLTKVDFVRNAFKELKKK